MTDNQLVLDKGRIYTVFYIGVPDTQLYAIHNNSVLVLKQKKREREKKVAGIYLPDAKPLNKTRVG